MQYRNILAAYDKSEPAIDAVKAAVELAASDAQCRLSVVSVMPTMAESVAFTGLDGDIMGATNMSIDGNMLKQMQDMAAEKGATDMHETLGDIIAPLGDRCIYEMAFGSSPATALLNYCKNKDCDCIVMGSRGLGGLRGVLGSVSYNVLRGSDVPVLIVK